MQYQVRMPSALSYTSHIQPKRYSFKSIVYVWKITLSLQILVWELVTQGAITSSCKTHEMC